MRSWILAAVAVSSLLAGADAWMVAPGVLVRPSAIRKTRAAVALCAAFPVFYACCAHSHRERGPAPQRAEAASHTLPAPCMAVHACSALPRRFPPRAAVHWFGLLRARPCDACATHALARVAPRGTIEALQLAPPCLCVHAPNSFPGSRLRKCMLYARAHTRKHTFTHILHTLTHAHTPTHTHTQVRRLATRPRRCARDSRGHSCL